MKKIFYLISALMLFIPGIVNAEEYYKDLLRDTYNQVYTLECSNDQVMSTNFYYVHYNQTCPVSQALHGYTFKSTGDFCFVEEPYTQHYYKFVLSFNPNYLNQIEALTYYTTAKKIKISGFNVMASNVTIGSGLITYEAIAVPTFTSCTDPRTITISMYNWWVVGGNPNEALLWNIVKADVFLVDSGDVSVMNDAYNTGLTKLENEKHSQDIINNQNQNSQNEINNANQNQQQTNERLDETNKELGELNDNITDSNIDSSEASGFFNNFNNTDHGGISGIVTAPLRFINNLTGTCEPISFELLGKNIELPCGDTLFWNKPEVENFRVVWNVLFGGSILFALLTKLFKVIQSLKNPDDSRIEVIKL